MLHERSVFQQCDGAVAATLPYHVAQVVQGLGHVVIVGEDRAFAQEAVSCDAVGIGSATQLLLLLYLRYARASERMTAD